MADSETPGALPAEPDPLDLRAQGIIQQANALIESMRGGDAETLSRIRDELKGCRARLLQVVVDRYNGDRDTAVLSDDYADDFSRLTDAIEPPKIPKTRGFPGTGKYVVGADGGGFVGK